MDDVSALKARLPQFSEQIDRLVLPHVTMFPAGPASDPRSSYVGGHPYLPAEVEWPTDPAGIPMTFLIQVNFATLPALPGYPTSGMLQWFVGSDDLFGLDYDDGNNGTLGFTARWYPASALTDTVPDPDTAAPYPDGACSPLISPRPTQILFESGRGLPCVQTILDRSPGHLAAHTADGAAVSAIYPATDLGAAVAYGFGDRIGGHPGFAQSDPRTPGSQCPTLLIQLATGFTMWGDYGAAQLFGDPSAVAEGDLSSLWWDWSCA